MKLRRLRMSDAALMLEWMHDESVVENLQKDFGKRTIEDCEKFILEANSIGSSMHLAIADEEDTYMGTVSLKNVSDACAEFAITVRKSAMGKGYAGYGMREIIRIGFEELGISRIYWCVSPENSRAVRFYDKQGYQRVDVKTLAAKIERNDLPVAERYFWYLKENKNRFLSSSDNIVATPVVLYHRLLPEGHKDLGSSAITFSQFEADLKYIKEMNYHTISFQEAIDFVKSDGSLPENPAILAFDDGYYNNYLYAMPLLQKYGMKASLAVICARINEADKLFIDNENLGYCNWKMIREMRDSGVFEITLHTYAMHIQKPRFGMTRMEGESRRKYCKALSNDIVKGKKSLKEKLNIDCRILVYPYGRTIDRAAINVLLKQGIELTAIVTSKGTNVFTKGDTDKLYNMARYNRAYGTSSEEFFQPIFERHSKAKSTEIERMISEKCLRLPNN